MGNNIPCTCMDHLADLSAATNSVKNERIEMLKRGNTFSKKAFLGITTKVIDVKLVDSTAAVQWETTGSSWTSSSEKGEIDLTITKHVKLLGETSMQFIAANETILFEMRAENSSIRDEWVLAINDLLQSWESAPDSKPKSSISAAGTSDKAAYFRQREEDIAERQKAAALRKEKYIAGGMKHTAQIMANRE